MTMAKEIIEIKDEKNGEKSKSPKGKPKGDKKSASSQPQIKKLQQLLKEQEEDNQKLIQEKNELHDKYLRTLAEMDNFHKRMKKEREDFKNFVLGEFLLELLQISDNLERALSTQAKSENDSSILSGVEMIFKQLQDLLKKYNVEEIDAEGQSFDPTVHQAISKEEDPDVDEEIVVEVYQKGFLYNKKLLRAAFVKVAIPKQEETGEEEQGQNGD
jgi:molecular chaperone GrpE